MRRVYFSFLYLLSLAGFCQPGDDSSNPKITSSTISLYSQNGRVGLQKLNNRPVTPAVYDTLYQINPSRYIGRRYISSKQQLMWGLIDNSGKQVIPFKYRKLTVSYDLVLVGYQDNNQIKYGVFSLGGTEVVKVEYDQINILSRSFIAARSNKQILVFNNLGIKTIQMEADSMTIINNTYSKFYKRGKVGLLHLSEQKVISASYRDIKVVNDKILVKNYPKWNFIIGYDTVSLNEQRIISWQHNFIASNNGKSWLISSDKMVQSLIYDSIRIVNNSLAIVSKNDKWGVINSYGHEIITLNYSAIAYDDEVIYARTRADDRKWNLFDYYGYPKNKLEYDSIKFITEGRIAIKRNTKWGFLDRFGIEVISPVYDKVSQFKDGSSIVTFFGEDGIIDREGKWQVLPSKFKICDHSNPIMLVILNHQYQVKSFMGELIYFTGNRLKMTKFGFIEYDTNNIDIIRNISWQGTIIQHRQVAEGTMAGGDGLTVFKANNKYGFKDQKGRIIIANRYDQVRAFNQKMAAININDKWGFIDLDENLIIQPKYDSVGYFDRGFCITRKNKLLGVVNLAGDEIIKNQYLQIVLLSNGRFRVLKNNYWGVFNEHGAIIIHEKYSKLIPVKQNYYIVKRNGKYGTLNLNGVNKIPLLYDFIGYNAESNSLTTKLSDKDEWVSIKETHSTNR